MPCTLSCSLATVFIICMIYFTNATHQSEISQKYQAQLPPNLQTLYKKIATERLNIYYFGYILGFILTLIIIIYNINSNPKQKMTPFTITCLTIAVSFSTSYFYYILSPKSAWMLDNIKDPQQTKAWLQMYRHMQLYYHIGLVLGIIAVGLVTFAFR